MGMSMETYTPEQFARSLYLRGYMGRKKAAEYVSDHPKEVWLESDFEKVYDDVNREPMRSKPIKGLTTNGKNLFAPESMK